MSGVQREQNGDETMGEGADSLDTFCATHPKVQTRLRCGKCDRPICPKCLVFTPVGARCAACADLKPLPQYQVSSSFYLRAVAAALGVAASGGLVWAILAGIPFIGGFLVVAVGYFAGEAVSRAVNRKSNRWLKVIAGLSVLAAYAVSGVVVLVLMGPNPAIANPSVLLTFVVRQFSALFSNVIVLLIFALGVYVAVSRVR